jgi:hypothetical protein
MNSGRSQQKLISGGMKQQAASDAVNARALLFASISPAKWRNSFLLTASTHSARPARTISALGKERTWHLSLLEGV